MSKFFYGVTIVSVYVSFVISPALASNCDILFKDGVFQFTSDTVERRKIEHFKKWFCETTERTARGKTAILEDFKAVYKSLPVRLGNLYKDENYEDYRERLCQSQEFTLDEEFKLSKSARVASETLVDAWEKCQSQYGLSAHVQLLTDPKTFRIRYSWRSTRPNEDLKPPKVEILSKQVGYKCGVPTQVIKTHKNDGVEFRSTEGLWECTRETSSFDQVLSIVLASNEGFTNSGKTTIDLTVPNEDLKQKIVFTDVRYWNQDDPSSLNCSAELLSKLKGACRDDTCDYDMAAPGRGAVCPIELTYTGGRWRYWVTYRCSGSEIGEEESVGGISWPKEDRKDPRLDPGQEYPKFEFSCD